MTTYTIYWKSASEGMGMSTIDARSEIEAANLFIRNFRTRSVTYVVIY